MGARQGQLCIPHFLCGLLHVLVFAAALQRGYAGTAELQDLVVLEHGQERVDLIGLASQLKDMLSGDRSMILAL